ncbi:MAG: tetratricopeptide repeat protein [Moraxellaceae bacterium]|nr:tetratricopeptide repeat protein [Moraxellaceae bacterium]
MSQHDEEQIENIKRFWQDYGTPILVGLTLAASTFGGWNYWQAKKADDASKAAVVFQEMLSAAQRSQLNPQDTAANTDLHRHGRTLKEDFSGTPFARNAALLLARQAVDRDDLPEAEKQLRWVIESKPDEALRVVATTRLARVLAAQKKPDEALALLAKEKQPGFEPTVDEVRGDILQSQGKIEDARKAYQSAWDALNARDEKHPLLEMKMSDVGLAVPAVKKPLTDGADAS